MMLRSVCGVSLAALVTACGAASQESAPATPAPAAAQAAPATPPAAPADSANGYRAILTVERLKSFMNDPKVVLIDARSPEDYAKGHIPGAINVHGELWRTPSAKGGKPSHDIFVRSDGSIDASKYEALLGSVGIGNDAKVIVYGNHGGKSDGSVPAMVMLALGHKEVGFLDGVGLDRWKAAGNPISTEVKTLRPATYKANVVDRFVWNTDQVRRNLMANDVVFVDARSTNEFMGADARDNKRAGRLPGAVNVNYEELLSKDKTTVTAREARQLLSSRGVTPDKKVIVYCQTGTRAAHNILVMRELGYSNVSVYDGSWQEWGNREDTPVEKP